MFYFVSFFCFFFFFQAEDGIRDVAVTGVQTCALPISAVAKAGAGGWDKLASAARSAGSCTCSSASSRMLRRKPSKLAPPFHARVRVNQEKYWRRNSGVQPDRKSVV